MRVTASSSKISSASRSQVTIKNYSQHITILRLILCQEIFFFYHPCLDSLLLDLFLVPDGYPMNFSVVASSSTSISLRLEEKHTNDTNGIVCTSFCIHQILLIRFVSSFTSEQFLTGTISSRKPLAKENAEYLYILSQNLSFLIFLLIILKIDQNKVLWAIRWPNSSPYDHRSHVAAGAHAALTILLTLQE